MTVPADALDCVESAPAGRFAVVRCEGSPAALVAVPQPGLAVRICSVTSPAFVLGSTQPIEAVDHGAAASRNVEVCRRRSGGGAVLVEPGAQLWFDAFVPVDDPLFDTDVGRAFGWLGAAVAEALAEVTGQSPAVHSGPLVRSRWSGALCLAGLGPGEVLVDGRKVVGACQRRDQRGAWFQAMVLLRFDPAASAAMLALTDTEREDARSELAASAAAVDADGEELERALLAALARR